MSYLFTNRRACNIVFGLSSTTLVKYYLCSWDFSRMDSVKTQEFKLEVDSELRFEIEKKDNKITVEVSTMERMKCFFTIVSYRIVL